MKLLPAQELPKTQRTNNTEAYEHYLLGMDISRRDRLEASKLAAEEFQKAITLDPGYANFQSPKPGVRMWPPARRNAQTKSNRRSPQ